MLFNNVCLNVKTLTNAVLLLLCVTLMPTAPILLDLITAPVRQDTLATENLAKVKSDTLANFNGTS